MRKAVMSILVVLALIAPDATLIAAPKSPKLAKCDGKQRRPANPYGSILPTVDPVTGTPTPANQPPGRGQVQERNGVEVFPEKAPPAPNPPKPGAKPAAQVPPTSSATPPTPCSPSAPMAQI
jgi:hypothetical protein